MITVEFGKLESAPISVEIAQDTSHIFSHQKVHLLNDTLFLLLLANLDVE